MVVVVESGCGGGAGGSGLGKRVREGAGREGEEGGGAEQLNYLPTPKGSAENCMRLRLLQHRLASHPVVSIWFCPFAFQLGVGVHL